MSAITSDIFSSCHKQEKMKKMVGDREEKSMDLYLVLMKDTSLTLWNHLGWI
jgi:hypothetical protein